MDKKAFRQETLKKRSTLYSEEIDAAIIDNFVHSDAYKKADWIMAYISFGTEINTHAFVKQALADGKHIVAPICNLADHTVTLSEILHFPGDLEAGHYGILEVKKDCMRIIDPKKLDLVMVPGMAFTEAGNRMGFGGGYYDRFLETINDTCVTVALIREDFIYDTIPMEAHDKSVDIIITEKRIKNCR
ncbi:MAG: 5-formyltetrahydrofolate cyclo-ligase [Eubacterium sp.]